MATLKAQGFFEFEDTAQHRRYALPIQSEIPITEWVARNEIIASSGAYYMVMNVPFPTLDTAVPKMVYIKCDCDVHVEFDHLATAHTTPPNLDHGLNLAANFGAVMAIMADISKACITSQTTTANVTVEIAVWDWT